VLPPPSPLQPRPARSINRTYTESIMPLLTRMMLCMAVAIAIPTAHAAGHRNIAPGCESVCPAGTCDSEADSGKPECSACAACQQQQAHADDGHDHGGSDDGHDTECSSGHDTRPGATSEERCVSLPGCVYDPATDHCHGAHGSYLACDSVCPIEHCNTPEDESKAECLECTRCHAQQDVIAGLDAPPDCILEQYLSVFDADYDPTPDDCHTLESFDVSNCDTYENFAIDFFVEHLCHVGHHHEASGSSIHPDHHEHSGSGSGSGSGSHDGINPACRSVCPAGECESSADAIKLVCLECARCHADEDLRTGNFDLPHCIAEQYYTKFGEDHDPTSADCATLNSFDVASCDAYEGFIIEGYLEHLCGGGSSGQSGSDSPTSSVTQAATTAQTGTKTKTVQTFSTTIPATAGAAIMALEGNAKTAAVKSMVTQMLSLGNTGLKWEDVESADIVKTRRNRRQATYTLEIVFKEDITAAQVSTAVTAFNKAVDDGALKDVSLDGLGDIKVEFGKATAGTKVITITTTTPDTSAGVVPVAAVTTVVASLLSTLM